MARPRPLVNKVLKVTGVVLVVLVVLLGAAWLKLRGPDIPYEVLEAKYADGVSHFVDLPDGTRAHYQDTGGPGNGGGGPGNGSGGDAAPAPVLLLLHGYGDSFTTWEGWVRELKSRFRIITVDFPGHGLTRAPEGYVLNGDRLVDFVVALADRLALPKFALAGNSMGGAVAWQLAAGHPQRVSALILVDAAGFPNEKPPAAVPLAFKILQYRLGRALLSRIDNRPLIDEGLKVDVFDKSLITAGLVDRWAEFQRAPGHRAILMSGNPGAMRAATAGELGRIGAPTLVLNGASDVLVEPASARKFAAAIPGAKLIIYPDVGHLPQLEIPARSAADVGGFLAAVY